MYVQIFSRRQGCSGRQSPGLKLPALSVFPHYNITIPPPPPGFLSVFEWTIRDRDCLMRMVSLHTTRLNVSISCLRHRFLPFIPCPHPTIHSWLRIIIAMCDPSVVGQTFKWVISAKFAWRDVTFSWEGEREAESALRLSQQMLSGSLACTHHPPSPSSHSHSPTSAPSGLLPASSLYPALYPPLSPPLCPALALLNPLAVVHTHCYVKAVV